MKYLLAIGSNVKPQKHVPWMLSQMINEFEGLRVGKFFSSTAQDMKSKRLFWNGAVLVKTSLSANVLKTQLCAWEELSGRNRNHPQCSQRDRTLDIDIIWSEKEGWYESMSNIKLRAYLAAPLASLVRIRLPQNNNMRPIFFNFKQRLLGGRAVRLK